MTTRDELKRAVLSMTDTQADFVVALLTLTEQERAALLAAVNERDEPDRA